VVIQLDASGAQIQTYTLPIVPDSKECND